MKYAPTPEFTSKVSALSSNRSLQTALAGVLRRIEELDPADLEDGVQEDLIRLPDGLLVLSGQSVRVFAALSGEGEDATLLLLDLAYIEPRFHRSFASVRDPRHNPSLNPRSNPTINPRSNPTINPRSNPTINPRSNPTINPRSNPSINPRSNPSVNYRANPTINPRSNPAINPRANPTLNPRINRSYDGLFVYGLDLQQEGFIVRANENVSLLFGNSLAFEGVLVSTSGGGFAVFDTEHNWTGTMIPNRAGGMLRFDTNNEWTGFAT